MTHSIRAIVGPWKPSRTWSTPPKPPGDGAGVTPLAGDDEFDTLGLGRFRNLERLGLTLDWSTDGGRDRRPLQTEAG